MTGHEHREAVNADADTRGGRHTIFECAHEIVVDNHRLVIALIGKLHLIHKAVVLIDGVVELGIGIRQLFAVDHQLKTLGQTGLIAVHLRKRRHLHWVVSNERRLNKRTLAGLAEDLINELTFAHRFFYFYAHFLSHFADLLFRHIAEVEAGLLLDGIEDRQTAIRCLEIHLIFADLHLGGAVYGDGNLLEEVLRKTHHPVVVFILNVELHAGELGVVVAVHPLVAEIASDLIYTLKTAYNQALEVELGSNTQIHIGVERVVVGDKRTSTCATCNLLQDRGLNLGVACFVEDATHGAEDCSTLEECVFYALVDNQIHITLTIALLGVVESVIRHTIFVLHDRQRAERFCENSELLGMHRNLAHLGAENKTFDTDDIADIEQFLEYHVIHLLLSRGGRLTFGRRSLNIVAAHIHLNAALRVLKLNKRSLTHDAFAHESAGNTNSVACVPFSFFARCRHLNSTILVSGKVDEISFDFYRMTSHFIFRCGVGVNAQIAHGLKRAASYLFLF